MTVGVISQSLKIVMTNEKELVNGPPPLPLIEPATVTVQTPTSFGEDAFSTNLMVGEVFQVVYSVKPMGFVALTPPFR